MIQPVAYAHLIPWDVVLTNNQNGHFVAKIVMGNVDCPDLSLEAHDVGFLWLGEIEEDTRGMAVYRRQGKGVESTPARLASALLKCENHDQKPEPEVAFYPTPHCTGTFPLLKPAPLPLDSGIHAGGPRKLHDQGLWISCGGGCCEAQFY